MTPTRAAPILDHILFSGVIGGTQLEAYVLSTASRFQSAIRTLTWEVMGERDRLGGVDEGGEGWGSAASEIVPLGLKKAEAPERTGSKESEH